MKEQEINKKILEIEKQRLTSEEKKCKEEMEKKLNYHKLEVSTKLIKEKKVQTAECCICMDAEVNSAFYVMNVRSIL